MSIERRRAMTAYGAELVLTPKEVGIKGSIAKAEELKAEIGDAWIPQQFENPANPLIHETTTAQEILKDFPEGPANLDLTVVDGTVQVTEEDAFAYAQRAAKEEGIFLGISSGASRAAVAQTIPSMAPGSRVLTFCYDTGDRYLSIDGLFQ
jgi:cysteine synthase A